LLQSPTPGQGYYRDDFITTVDKDLVFVS